MATEVKVSVSNGVQSSTISSNLNFLIRASKATENNFKDENFVMREYEIKPSLYLDIAESFGVQVEDISLLGIFVTDYDYETKATNQYRFNIQIGENVVSDMACFLCGNVDGFTDAISVSFDSLPNIEKINASLQIVLITK